MFGKKKDEPVVATNTVVANKKPAFEPATKTIIGSSTCFVGDFVTKDDLVVEGSLNGNVQSTKLLTIKVGGSYKGTAVVRDLSLDGSANGDISVENHSNISASGKLSGSLKTQKFTIDPNSIFEGNLSISHKVQPEVIEAAKAETTTEAE